MEGGDLEYLVKNNFTTLPFEQQLKNLDYAAQGKVDWTERRI